MYLDRICVHESLIYDRITWTNGTCQRCEFVCGGIFGVGNAFQKPLASLSERMWIPSHLKGTEIFFKEIYVYKPVKCHLLKCIQSSKSKCRIVFVIFFLSPIGIFFFFFFVIEFWCHFALWVAMQNLLVCAFRICFFFVVAALFAVWLFFFRRWSFIWVRKCVGLLSHRLQYYNLFYLLPQSNVCDFIWNVLCFMFVRPMKMQIWLNLLLYVWHCYIGDWTIGVRMRMQAKMRDKNKQLDMTWQQ